MGDSLAQAALILVHLNLFSSTANWDLGAWKEDTLVCECIFFYFLHNSQGCEGAFFSFLAMFTNFGSQKKKTNIYKAREAKDHRQPS